MGSPIGRAPPVIRKNSFVVRKKLIGDLQDSEFARFFVVLPGTARIAFGIPN
jgi:hypothetical protein